MAATRQRFDNVAQLLHQLGDIPAERVLMRPTPGRATEKHLLAHLKRKGAGCELVDGTLVEKAVGFRESTLASWLSHLLYEFIGDRDLGEIAGAGGALRLYTGLVRAPDVSFIRRDRLPGGELPEEPVPGLAPCLAVEVLSKGNAPAEMARKRREYFLAGTELVWQIDLVRREVEVFTRPESGTALRDGDTLGGGDVLPGLALPVCRIFDRLPAN
ncbi:MAG: Uma2 family endonuclease [Gemmataceae bacterium]